MFQVRCRNQASCVAFALSTRNPQGTRIRQYVSAKAFPNSVEQEKPEAMRGLFLHPEHYGYPRKRGIDLTRQPDRMHDPRHRGHALYHALALRPSSN